MNTTLITSDTLDLLSEVTGKKLSNRDTTPLVLFLASLVTVLLGVLLVDGVVEEEEKQRLLKILYRFSLPESDARRLTHLMIRGVKENQTYTRIQDLLKITAPLSESEKLLLIGFGYQISVINGNIGSCEQKYLEIVGKKLGIKSPYLAVLEFAMTHKGSVEPSTLDEIYFLLDSSQFQELDTVFLEAAGDILTNLPTKPALEVTAVRVDPKQLDNYCYQLFCIIVDCKKYNLLSRTLIEEVSQVLQCIQSFNQSFEKYSTSERGKLIRQSMAQINSLIQKSLDGLYQSQETLEEKIQISEAQKQEILEKIGEVSGRDIKISTLISSVAEEAHKQARDSWEEWQRGLCDRIAQKSQYWDSEHNPVFSQDKLIGDYTNLFIRDLSTEIDEWGNKVLKDTILKEKLYYLDTGIACELENIQGGFKQIDQQVKTNFSEQINMSIIGIGNDFMGLKGLAGGLGVGGALAAGLIVFTGLGFIAIVVTTVAATIASSFGLGMLDFDGLKTQIKQKVCDIGIEKFKESTDKLLEKIDEIITLVFDARYESITRLIEQAISLYENLLEQQEKLHQETLEQREVEKVLIYRKCQELEHLQHELKAISNS